MNMLLWLHIMVYIAVTLLASTVVKSQAAAAAIGFGFLLVLTFLGSLPTIGAYLPGQLTVSALAVFSTSTVSIWPAVVVSLGVIVVCMIVAWIAFDKQEL